MSASKDIDDLKIIEISYPSFIAYAYHFSFFMILFLEIWVSFAFCLYVDCLKKHILKSLESRLKLNFVWKKNHCREKAWHQLWLKLYSAGVRKDSYPHPHLLTFLNLQMFEWERR